MNIHTRLLLRASAHLKTLKIFRGLRPRTPTAAHSVAAPPRSHHTRRRIASLPSPRPPTHYAQYRIGNHPHHFCHWGEGKNSFEICGYIIIWNQLIFKRYNKKCRCAKTQVLLWPSAAAAMLPLRPCYRCDRRKNFLGPPLEILGPPLAKPRGGLGPPLNKKACSGLVTLLVLLCNATSVAR